MIAFPKKTFAALDGLSIGVFDSEANGFVKSATHTFVSWVIDARNPTKRQGFQGKPNNIKKYLAYLDTFDVLCGHNIIGYDLPLYKKLYNWEPASHVILLDTLWMSRLYYPDIEGGHSLGAWGLRLGNEKTEYYPVHDPDQPSYDPSVLIGKDNKGWDTAVYTVKMDDYCEQDVCVNVDLLCKLLEMLQNYSWSSIICEMMTAVIIQRQMEHGFVFDYKSAELLHADFMEQKFNLEDEVRETFEPLPKLIKVVQPKVKKDGKVSSVGLKSLGDDWADLIVVPEYTREEIEGQLGVHPVYSSGSYSLIEWPEFSLGSRQQIAERLTRAGYKLTKFTDKGNPIIDDGTLSDAVAAGIPEAKPLAEYFLITKREGMVKDWLARAEWHEDQGVYRIHGFVNSLGAATNRMTHNSPNVAQVPATHTDKHGNPILGLAGGYGKECRALFKVRQGYTLVGCDADGLELRCLAHYMGDLAYADTIINGKKSDGTDIHTVNQHAAGLLTRDQAKVFVYAFLYGAGDGKLGAIVGGTAKDGKRLKERFLDATPALRKLRARIQSATDGRKWLKGVDGRIIRIRSQHAALNTLLQGMGAIVMKYWLIEVASNADKEGLDWNPCANVHDEGQFEVLDKDVKRFSEICEAAFLTISSNLGLKCVCTGSADSGRSWDETH